MNESETSEPFVAASMAAMPAGMTSLPMPSPAMTATLYVFDMYASCLVWSAGCQARVGGPEGPHYSCFGTAVKVITHATAAAARPAIAGVRTPQPRPPVRRCTAERSTHTRDHGGERAGRRRATHVQAGDNRHEQRHADQRVEDRERVDDAAERDGEQRPERAARDGRPPGHAQHPPVVRGED